MVASTDYDLYQSEELGLVSCGECESNQVKIEGSILDFIYYVYIVSQLIN